MTGVGDPISYDNNVTTTFPVTIQAAGTVPTTPRASIRLSAAFLNPAFKRTDLAGIKFGNASALWVFSDNIAAPKHREVEKEDGTIEFAKDDDGDLIPDRSVPHLLGLCGLDFKKYAKVSSALIDLWPDRATKSSEIKAVLEQYLPGSEIGFWLIQKQEKVGETVNDKGDTVGIWEPTNLWNVRAPKFEDAAYFRPDSKGRSWILSRVRDERNVIKVGPRAGEVYKKATFDEATAF